MKVETKGQLELAIDRPREFDRNYHLGGRSFYFFDFDDNVAHLSTPTVLFHKENGSELLLNSGEFARIHRSVGVSGIYRDFQISYCDQTGTFRYFRDRDPEELRKLGERRQYFVEDLWAALGKPDLEWKGPSWSCFVHATLNQRPMTLITARGHSRNTITQGLDLFIEAGHLNQRPNLLAVFPVTNPDVRTELGDINRELNVAELKRRAIRASVEAAFRTYGFSPYHRFGMSDDDPHNIELIVSEMTELKRDFPEVSFFVIETQGGRFVKWEIYADHSEPTLCAENSQLGFFENTRL